MIECPSCKSKDDVSVIEDYTDLGQSKGVCDRCFYEWLIPLAFEKAQAFDTGPFNPVAEEGTG